MGGRPQGTTLFTKVGSCHILRYTKVENCFDVDPFEIFRFNIQCVFNVRSDTTFSCLMFSLSMLGRILHWVVFEVQSFDVSLFEVQSFKVQSVNLSLSSSQTCATVPLRVGKGVERM
jgi:hypothetical protein